MTMRLHMAGLLALAIAAPLCANGPEPDSGSRAQERLDREVQRAADRAAEQAQRFAEERARIEERAVRDPTKAAEDLAKLEADEVKEQAKESEDAAKAQDDFESETTKEAEDAAKQAEDRGEGLDSMAGSSELIRDLGQSEGADHDHNGFAVRRGEVVGIDLSAATITAAEARGFKVIERTRLASLDREVVRLGAPGQTDAETARRLLQAIDPKAVVDMVHYYGLGLTAGEASRPVRTRAQVARAVPRDALVVGVIDTAVSRHSALGQSRIVPWAAGELPAAPREHGTAVASLLAGQGRATIYSANIFRGPAGQPFTSADIIASALDWMIAQGVPIINMSLAGPRNAILDSLLRDAQRRGHVIVAAAGNGGPGAPPAYPAAVSGVVAVTAVDDRNQVYRYANRGRYISVAARGVDVVAANSHGGFARFTGTSFASPHVAGWLARCRAKGGNSAQCQEQLRKEARDLGVSGFDEVYGFGLID